MNPAKKIKIIYIVNGILAVGVIAALLMLVRNIASISLGTLKKPQPQNSLKQQKNIPQRTLTDYSSILKKNPFGFYAGELSLLGSKTEGSRISADVMLVGTISGDEKFAYAIFADKSDMQEVFKIGDSVFGIGRLTRVEKDKVIVDAGGKTTEIQITDIIAVKEAYLSGAKTNAPSDSFSADKFAKKVTDTSYMIDGQRVQQALSNPNQIMTDARLLPNVVNGRQEGFILREVKTGGVYSSLGLQNGDVLLRINEYNISNPEAALQAFTALKGMDKVQLDIIRNSSRMTMTYQIR